ncbi:MAG: hypothetical protein ISP88_15540 [Pseudomonadales bacterium]|nr:hypothetical protein [Pseudomonadales bacterium]
MHSKLPHSLIVKCSVRDSLQSLVMVLVLLAAQAVSVQHIHANDISPHVDDCVVCHTQSIEDDQALTQVGIAVINFSAAPLIVPETSRTSFTPIVANSRAPPTLMVV